MPATEVTRLHSLLRLFWRLFNGKWIQKDSANQQYHTSETGDKTTTKAEAQVATVFFVLSQNEPNMNINKKWTSKKKNPPCQFWPAKKYPLKKNTPCSTHLFVHTGVFNPPEDVWKVISEMIMAFSEAWCLMGCAKLREMVQLTTSSHTRWATVPRWTWTWHEPRNAGWFMIRSLHVMAYERLPTM